MRSPKIRKHGNLFKRFRTGNTIDMQTFQMCTTEIPAGLPSTCGRVRIENGAVMGVKLVASCRIALWDPNSHNSPIQGPYLALRTSSTLLLKRTPMILFERRGTLRVHRAPSTYARKFLLFLKPKKKHLYKTRMKIPCAHSLGQSDPKATSVRFIVMTQLWMNPNRVDVRFHLI
jgi:hypothetical protein